MKDWIVPTIVAVLIAFGLRTIEGLGGSHGQDVRAARGALMHATSSPGNGPTGGGEVPSVASAPDAPSANMARFVPVADRVREIDWLELMPPEEVKSLEQLSQVIDHTGGRMEQMFTSAKVVPGMNGVRGKLPGYVVPIGSDGKGKVTEFFFVPYFGACIHMPPPPPNQIVYVKPKAPLAVDDIWDAVWIVGTVRVGLTRNAMAMSSYTFDLEKIEKMDESW